MGYVTQSRSTRGPKAISYYNGTPLGSGLQTIAGGILPDMTPTQTTQSYRTGRLVESLPDDEETALLTAGSSRGVFKALKEEYRRAKQSSYDTGHTFDSDAKYFRAAPKFRAVASDPKYVYEGVALAEPTYYQTLAAPAYWPAKLGFSESAYGPRAINATIPTHPLVGLSTTLAELKREGIPALVGSSLIRGKGPLHRNIGGEYLNYEFGYKPLASDLGRAAAAAVDAGNLLRQYQRGSGRLIHATYTFPPETSTTVYPQRTGRLYVPSPTSVLQRDIWVGGASGRFGNQIEEVSTVRRVWFRGAYTYYLQQEGSIFDNAQRLSQEANHLFGTRVDESTFWSLTPWSWLVDWHVNIGDNISNASALASDGLVLQYGYLMVEDLQEHRITIEGPRTLSGTSGPWTTSFTRVTKRRFKATPFGFGRNPAGFTARQWSILGALGLSKSPGVLH